jgi:hypothetical protein
VFLALSSLIMMQITEKLNLYSSRITKKKDISFIFDLHQNLKEEIIARDTLSSKCGFLFEV